MMNMKTNYYNEIKNVDSCSMKYSHESQSIIEMFLTSNNWGSLIEPLANFYNKWGYGNFARFRALVWYHDINYSYLKGNQPSLFKRLSCK